MKALLAFFQHSSHIEAIPDKREEENHHDCHGHSVTKHDIKPDACTKSHKNEDEGKDKKYSLEFFHSSILFGKVIF